jgi:hypothetical protein
MKIDDYTKFLDDKCQSGSMTGFEPTFLPDCLFDFQKALTTWAIQKGRAAIFADCGLGKTLIELVWAENVCRKTNKDVLILTPLAVSHQHISEAEKFGIEAHRINGVAHKGINVVNYERLHHVNPDSFGGIVCDESSIFKSFDGSTRKAATEFMRKIPYRLMATATAAPNDYIELGTTSDALGELGYVDMLNRFFKNDNNNSGTRRHYGEAPKWRFKGHAELPFWRWVCSWARAIRKPSDIGFDDSRFVLPPLTEKEHILKAEVPDPELLFALPAVGLKEQRAERRRTIDQRCEEVAKLVKHKDQALVWCQLNDEGDLLEKMIPDSVQISGDNTDEEKEEAFIGFAKGEIRVMVIKPKIGAHGLNFQNCHHVTFFPSHSWEQYYQGVRRCWRFGQTKPVRVDIVSTEGEVGVLKNLQRKAGQADRMFTNLVSEMNRAVKVERGSYGTEKEKIPSWLS